MRRPSRAFGLLAACIGLLAGPAAHAGAGACDVRMVRDVNTQPVGSSPFAITALGDDACFMARDSVHGLEPWRSDGTLAGTRLVTDAVPGPASLRAYRHTSAGSLIFLVADDGLHGFELWRTDGTEAGTFLLLDALAGPRSGFPDRLVVADGRAWFRVDADGLGQELWVSDGTVAGTRLVADLEPGEASSSPTPLAVVGGRLTFATTNAVWTTDGTPAGTSRVKDIDGYFSQPLGVAGDIVVFSVHDHALGLEPWRTDGTEAGTFALADLRPGAMGSRPQPLGVAGSRLVLAADDGTHGAEPWITDGTTSGTSLIEDITPGAPSSVREEPGASLGDRLAFVARDASHGYEPWVTDGTDAGTFMLRDVLPGSNPSNPSQLASVGGSVFFVAAGPQGAEPWITDGTPAGTRVVKDIVPGPPSSNPRGLIAAGPRAFFSAYSDGVTELWVSDGTDAGTVLIDVPDDRSSGSQVVEPTVVGDALYFQAFEPATGLELWRSDGTEAGTSVVRDTIPGPFYSQPERLAAVGSRLFFRAHLAPSGFEPWVSDGTEAGTREIVDLRPGGAGSLPESFLEADGRAWFSADDGTHGRELWVSDGTAAGTTLAADLLAGSAPSDPEPMAALGGTLVLSAELGAGRCVLAHDTVASITTMLSCEAPVPGRAVAVVGGRAFYEAGEGTSSEGLWVTDGTAAGTRFLHPLPLDPDYGPAYAVHGGSLAFAWIAPPRTTMLATTDGTPAGTRVLESIEALTASYAWPPRLASAGGRLVLVERPSHPMGGSIVARLWRSDGVSPATAWAFMALPEEADVSSRDMLTVGGAAWFASTVHGVGTMTLWTTDGTAAGTYPASPAMAGMSFRPDSLRALGTSLALVVDDRDHGDEPWIVGGCEASCATDADCDDGIECTLDSCDPASGTCANDERPCTTPPTCNVHEPLSLSCREIRLDRVTLDDPDGDALTWTITSPDPAITVEPASGSWPAHAGAARVVVTARLDGGALPCDREADLTVTVVDSHLASSSCLVPVRFHDGLAPALRGVPADESAPCDAVPSPGMPAAIDDCDPSPAVALGEAREDGPCPDTFVLRRTWTATDACGNSTSARQALTVTDTQPPALSGVPADATVSCEAVPPPATPSARDACDPAPRVELVERRVDGPCPGTHDLVRTWTATDRCGNSTSAAQVVRVVDDVAPVVTWSVARSHLLWPPNHRRVTLSRAEFAPAVRDACSEPVTWRFAACRSSQADDDRGDGATSGDCVVEDDAIRVRAERDGRDRAGRDYEVLIVARDACGNESAPTPIATVHVPHDR